MLALTPGLEFHRNAFSLRYLDALLLDGISVLFFTNTL